MNDTDYALVKSEIASFIGTPEANWDTRTAADVDSAIRRGIEAVIHNAASHQWSWMRPTYRFQTADEQRFYTLPLDFEQFIGDIYFDGAEYGYPSIKQLPSGRIAQLYSEYENTGVPTRYALEVQSHDGAGPQQYQLVLHPTPDAEYSLAGPYQVGPIRKLSNERPYFPGGPENRDLFIASCLAAAESKFMDQPMTDKSEQFQTAMIAAIGRDHRRQPRNLGKMNGGRGRPREDYRYKLSVTHDAGEF